MQKFKPWGDRVLVRPIQPAPKEGSLLDLGSTTGEQQVVYGEVLGDPPSRGADAMNSPLGMRLHGKTIAYLIYSGKTIKMNGEELVLLAEEEILGLMEEVD